MHIPSERVYKEMKSEIASLWFVPTIGGDEIALVVKAPTSAIKALILGCPMELIFGKEKNYLCTAIKIFDIPDAPIFISRVQKELEEHKALIKCLKLKKFPIFLFNEMDTCVACSELEITAEDSYNTINFIGDENLLYVGKFDNNASHILDCFCYSTDNSKKYLNAHIISTFNITPISLPWKEINNYFYGNREFQKINVSDIYEGEMLEKTIWSIMASVFPSNIYKSPQVQIGQKTRELTDVLAYYKYSSFLIEVKDSSIIKAGYNLNQDKRLSNIQKQIKKAIKQLSGAAKAFSRGDDIFDSSGNKLVMNRTQIPHCIILITELMHYGNWDEIQSLMLDTMESTNAFFHLLDVRELMTLVKSSSGNPELIDYNLMQRYKVCIENKSIFVRSK